jgi:hypothetical protein
METRPKFNNLGEQIYLLQEVNPVWLHEHIKDFWRSPIPAHVGGSLESWWILKHFLDRVFVLSQPQPVKCHVLPYYTDSFYKNVQVP